jgi:hypothetical protein
MPAAGGRKGKKAVRRKTLDVRRKTKEAGYWKQETGKTLKA